MRSHAKPPTTPGPPGPPGPTGATGPSGSGSGGGAVDLIPASDVVLAADTSLVVSGIYELTAGVALEIGVGAVMDIL